MPDDKPLPAALEGFRFWKAEGTSTDRREISAGQIVRELRLRDIYALCQHGAISHAGARFYSELKR